jgi:hypothetical protein
MRTATAAGFRVTEDLHGEIEEGFTAKRGVALARAIYRTEPQARITGREIRPGADINTPENLETYIRVNAGVTQHPVGMCSMGLDRVPRWTRGYEFTVSKDFGWPMLPSFPPYRKVTPTPLRLW